MYLRFTVYLYQQKQRDMKATLTFTTNEQATKFSLQWSRATCNGHTVFNNTVTVYGVDSEGKDFIDNYIKQLNNN